MSVSLKRAAPVDPAWLAYARQFIGTREVKGPRHEPRILAMAKRAARFLGIAVRDDETPWCGTFAADCVLTGAGINPPPIAVRAKAWATWGVNLGLTIPQPPLGTVAVFGRDGGGHVGFVVGVHRGGDLAILGGNQGDEVNIRRFPRARLVALRWPAGVAVGAAAPMVEQAGVRTTGEA
jgi:uncharacterized protein (TIGR02594 family)